MAFRDTGFSDFGAAQDEGTVPRYKCVRGPLTGWRVLGLFSGTGADRIATEALGGECVGMCEIDPAARETVGLNFPGLGAKAFPKDVRKLRGKAIPAHDILVATFPCQDFSIAGDGLGLVNDGRGGLFFEVLGVARKARPSVVLLENVPRLGTIDGGRAIRRIEREFRRLGYGFTRRVLNAADFGLPQERKRLYMVATRLDVLRAAGGRFKFPKGTAPRRVVADILEPGIPVKVAASRITATSAARVRKNAPERVGIVDGRTTQGARVYSTDRAGITLTAASGGLGAQTGLYQVPGGARQLTPRECARMQGFPEWYQPHPREAQARKQFGNAVAVPVIQAVLAAIGALLLGQARADARAPLVGSDAARLRFDSDCARPEQRRQRAMPTAPSEGARRSKGWRDGRGTSTSRAVAQAREHLPHRAGTRADRDGRAERGHHGLQLHPARGARPEGRDRADAQRPRFRPAWEARLQFESASPVGKRGARGRRRSAAALRGHRAGAVPSPRPCRRRVMICKLSKGRSARSLCGYLARERRPELRAHAAIIGQNIEGKTPGELAQQFRLFQRLRPTVGRSVLHASLSKSPHDRALDEREWREIAERFMSELGFADSAWVAYRHSDRAHEHIHIVGSRIDSLGRVVSESNDYRRAEAIVRRIETDYRLLPVAPSKASLPRQPQQQRRKTMDEKTRKAIEERLEDSATEAEQKLRGALAPSIDAAECGDAMDKKQELEHRRFWQSAAYEEQLREILGDEVKNIWRKPGVLVIYTNNGGRINDTGSRIQAFGMSDRDAARLVVQAAMAKGWVALSFTGSSRFCAEAMRYAISQGLRVVPRNEAEKAILVSILSEGDNTVVPVPDKPITPPPSPPPLRDPLWPITLNPSQVLPSAPALGAKLKVRDHQQEERRSQPRRPGFNPR